MHVLVFNILDHAFCHITMMSRHWVRCTSSTTHVLVFNSQAECGDHEQILILLDSKTNSEYDQDRHRTRLGVKQLELLFLVFIFR